MKLKKDQSILRLDLDLDSQIECISLLKSRLSFMQDSGYFNSNKILSIQLIKKRTYGAIIILNKSISQEMCFSLQSLLGSDYKKEICAQINHYKYNMKYSDRLFTIKRYPNGSYLEAKVIDISKQVKHHVLNSYRKKQQF